jgi:hypothetical protein
MEFMASTEYFAKAGYMGLARARMSCAVAYRERSILTTGTRGPDWLQIPSAVLRHHGSTARYSVTGKKPAYTHQARVFVCGFIPQINYPYFFTSGPCGRNRMVAGDHDPAEVSCPGSLPVCGA